MHITDAAIDRAEHLGACPDALIWLRAEPRTWAQGCERYAEWLLEYAAEHLPPVRLDACAAAEPRAALRIAADRLTPERLEACAASEPRNALRFAADLLTPARLDACAALRPHTALRYAADLLTAERLDACAAAVAR